MQYHFTTTRLANIKNFNISNVGQDVQESENSHAPTGHTNSFYPLKKIDIS